MSNCLVSGLLALGSLLGVANAALVVSNFSLTASSASFTLSGTVEAGFVAGSGEPDIVFVGSAAPFDQWILSDGVLVSQSNGAGSTARLEYTNTSGFNPDFFGSDWFRFRSLSGSWVGGEVIDYSIRLTGQFDPQALPPSLVVQQGWADVFNLIGSAGTVGSSVVPEPSVGILAGLGVLGVVTRRRRL